jgi:sugar lactone lactonase YvrE
MPHRAILFRGTLVIALLLHDSVTRAQTFKQALDSLPNPFRTIEDVLHLPGGRAMGWVMGLAVDRDGRSLWLFEACGGMTCLGEKAAPIVKFDSSGKVVRQFGAGTFAHPHGLYVDPQGDVWAIDGSGGSLTPVSPTEGQQVFKFSPDGKLLLTLGKPGIAGNGPDTFNMPSDVLVAPSGDIFVADGHGSDSNARIVKFSKDGMFIKTWGKKGTAPGEFDGPHSLAMDSRGRLFVADRYNYRIQIFDQNGTLLEVWPQFGASSELLIDKSDVLYSANITTNEQTHPGWKKGIVIGDARTGKVTGFIPDPDPNGSLELIALDAQGTLWGGLTLGKSVRKFVKR